LKKVDKAISKEESKEVIQTDKNKPKSCFVYGRLRPDDDCGLTMVKDAIEGMTARKAIVKNAGLYKDEYAAAILGKQGKQVVGYVLTHSDDMVFAIKLEYIDAIEGYNEYMASQGLY